MRTFFISALALVAMLSFSSFGSKSVQASDLSHRPVLNNHHLQAPGHTRQRSRHHVRQRKFVRGNRFGRHHRRSIGAGFGFQSRGFHQTRRVRQHRRVDARYRNRTQFCRRAWEIVSGREVLVRRCVWVHNSKLRGANVPAIEGH